MYQFTLPLAEEYYTYFKMYNPNPNFSDEQNYNFARLFDIGAAALNKSRNAFQKACMKYMDTTNSGSLTHVQFVRGMGGFMGYILEAKKQTTKPTPTEIAQETVKLLSKIPEAGQIAVRVNLISGESYVVNVAQDAFVSEVKQVVNGKIASGKVCKHLLFAGKQLPSDKSIQELGVGMDSLLTAVLSKAE